MVNRRGFLKAALSVPVATSVGGVLIPVLEPTPMVSPYHELWVGKRLLLSVNPICSERISEHAAESWLCGPARGFYLGQLRPGYGVGDWLKWARGEFAKDVVAQYGEAWFLSPIVVMV